jgi:toxin ParE1/3/4
MRRDVHLDVSARNDLVEIWEYMSENSVSDTIADRFVERIKARCEKIGDVPHIGTARDDILPGLRMVPFERSAVILYMLETDRVRITNIFYGGRDYEALMRKSP